MKREIWKPHPDKEFSKYYSISNNGRVLSMNNYNRGYSIYLRPCLNKKRGYYYINCQTPHKRKNYILHRLVAKLFIKNPKSLPHVDHIDFDKSNNKASNLQWVSQSENIKKNYVNNMTKPRRGELSGMSKLKNEDIVDMRFMRFAGLSQKEISNKFRVARCTVSLILSGKRWGHI